MSLDSSPESGMMRRLHDSDSLVMPIGLAKPLFSIGVPERTS